MSFLQDLFGDQHQQQGYQDFINRYQQGPPQEGYTNQEAWQRYQQVAPQLPAQDYEQAAAAAFENMSPQDRQQFAQFVQQQAQQQGMQLPGFQQGGGMQDSRQLARAMAQAHQQSPDMLQSLLGSGGALSNPMVKAAVAGIAAMAAQRIMGGQQQQRGRSIL
jgi:hypothetical protein